MENVSINAVVVEEAGYKAAMRGLSFNKKRSVEEMHQAALKLCSHDGGHNKFLESLIIWIEVQAPRFWWQEGDTYRLSTKQSESTMHTLVKELQSLERSNLQRYGIDNFDGGIITEDNLIELYNIANEPWTDDDIERLVRLKRIMPEGFLQKRMWCMSYKTFRNMYLQRKNHRLPHWPKFLKQVLSQLKHPELLGVVKETCKDCVDADDRCSLRDSDTKCNSFKAKA